VFAIYFLKPENRSAVDAMKDDDLIGRQSIITKDASNFDFREPGLIVLVEGSNDAISSVDARYGSLMEKLNEKRSAQFYALIKDEEKKADEGMGFLFG
jgi:hypothetical protein